MSSTLIFLSLLGFLVLASVLWTTALKHTDGAFDHRSIPQHPWASYGSGRTDPAVEGSGPSTDLALYRMEWRAVRARFRRSPGLAIAQADDLLRRLQEGGGYSAPGGATRPHMRDLGTVLDWATRRDLKRVFAYYRSILNEVLETSAADEIVLHPVPPERMDLRIASGVDPRRLAGRSR